tara:strand:+ start:2600 stop:3658 length:1059 start_codon:yes stop_codon:yes gene_type:complete
MLRAQYDNNKYTFYVTLKDTYTYNAASGTGFLFKFTNDMSGAIKWGYGQNVVNSDRYTKLTIFSTQGGIVAEDVIFGIVNLEPNGYWKYEIYLTDYFPNTPCGGADPTQNGIWECTNTAPTVVDSGSLNVDVEEIKLLTADTYTIGDLSTCDPHSNYNTMSQVIKYIDCQSAPPRMFYFTRVVRNTTTNTFYIDSVANVGTYIKIQGTGSGGIVGNFQTYIHTITSDPEQIVINIATNDTYTFEHYSSTDVLLDTYNEITAKASLPPFFMYDVFAILCSNNEYAESDECGNGLPFLGSIFFGMNKIGNQLGGETLDGPLELGKLYVEEQVGSEQVQYTEREAPPSTNYIYND